MTSFPAFERFNPEGNSPDAVVYLEDQGLLQYKQTLYKAGFQIPADAVVICGSPFPEHIILIITPKDGDTFERSCELKILLTGAQKDGLTHLFQQHGNNVAVAVNKVLESVDRLREVIQSHNKKLNAICPGLIIDCLDVNPDCDFKTGTCETEGIRNLERIANEMITDARCLAYAEPFSKKRKSN